MQKEQELAAKLTELNEKQSQIEELKQARQQLEDSLNAKITALQTSLQNADAKAKTLADKIDAMLQEKDLLTSDNATRAKEIAQLTQKVKVLEHERDGLLDKIKTLEAQGADAVPGEAAPDKRTAYDQPYGMRNMARPAVDAVKLGNIIVQKISGNAAQVEQVNPVQNFIVINVGSRDGVRSGTIINIIRDDRLIAKAVVKETRSNLSAAIVLPEWTRDTIEPGDFITRF